jgi:hypothetical protein
MSKSSGKKITAFLAIAAGLGWLVFSTWGCDGYGTEPTNYGCDQEVTVYGPFTGTINQDCNIPDPEAPLIKDCNNWECNGKPLSFQSCQELTIPVLISRPECNQVGQP